MTSYTIRKKECVNYVRKKIGASEIVGKKNTLVKKPVLIMDLIKEL